MAKSTQIAFARTINELIENSINQNPSYPAVTAKYGKEWRSLTFSELGVKLKLFSLGLRVLGINKGDRVAVLSENRPEWAIADLGIVAMGAVTIPIYPTLPPSQVAHIINDSGARAIIVSDAKQLKKVLDDPAATPNLTILITMEDSAAKGDVNSFDSVMKLGETDGPALSPTFDELRKSVNPEDLASLVYTSGTTGDPKGAMLTHGNLTSAARIAEKALPFDREVDSFLSFLPLCHVFERITYYLALGMGVNTSYAESIFKVQENMAEVKPTLMQSVPRLFEAIYDRVNDTIAKASEKERKAFGWALGIGKQYAQRTNAGSAIGPVLAIQHLIADKIVLSKVRERFGGRFRIFVSGGAPINRESAEFFQAIGIPVMEGYGLTETTAAATVNPYNRAKIGSVGKPFPEVTLKIAPDGEILIKGPGIMAGYWNKPDSTAEVIDSDGWLHSGDIGEIDSDGYLKITDRKKDILVLANGKKVAPQPIENHLKAASLIAEIVLLGDSSGTVSALVVPNFDRLSKWAKEKGLPAGDLATLTKSPEARKAVKSEIDSLSGNLAEFEKIRKVALLDHPLTIENGELTPTLKVKRKVVREKYGHLLD